MRFPRIRCLLAASLPVLACVGAVAVCAVRDSSQVFPNDLAPEAFASKGSRAWTVPDVVQVTRIKGLAIRGSTRDTAFILQRPSIARERNLYALYTINPANGRRARKLFEADYMADLSSRTGSSSWTVRADTGNAVQLYEVSTDGVPHSVV